MSVINQVLNQLEQRGEHIEQRDEHVAPEQAMVRAVPHGKRSLALPLLALLLALASGVAAWQWIQMRKPALSTVEGHAPSAAEGRKVVAAIPAPVSAVSAVASTVVAASAVDANGVVEVTGAASAGETHAAEILPPASRLSFELSAIPLPSSLRKDTAPRDAKNGSAPDRGEKQPANPEPPVRVAKPQPIQTATSGGRAVAQSIVTQASGGALPMKQVSAEQRADAEFRRAVAAMQQGHIADAIAGYRAVLRLDTGHDEARQALVALLLESRQGEEAERVLRDRLTAKPAHTGFAMLLARLQVEHGALEPALATLEKSLSYADAQADYQAFFAALLQRMNRHQEAAAHYQIALQLAPDNGIWQMGYGISLQALQRIEDARNAFKRALESKTLSSELQAFVQQKLKGL